MKPQAPTSPSLTSSRALLSLSLIGLLLIAACKNERGVSDSDPESTLPKTEQASAVTEATATTEATSEQEDASLDTPEANSSPTSLAKGSIEVFAELPVCPGNIAVTQEDRVFLTVHPFRPAEAQLIEVTGFNEYEPWPNEEWNAESGSGPNVLNSPLGIVIDAMNRLWVIDTGTGEEDQTPKLIAFAIDSGEVLFRYDFPETTGPKGSFIQDLAVDEDNGFVYLADVGGQFEPAIIVVDLNANESRRITGHPSFQAEDVDLVVEDQALVFSKGDGQVAPARIAINPITLSADKETLYYGAMNGQTWWSLPTQLLREGAESGAIFDAIEKVGQKPVSDGASTDAEGNHYFTNLNENAIDILTAEGELKRLVQDDRLSWPDALSFGQSSWLYIAVNQLHRSPKLTGGEEKAELPYRIMRVWTTTKGIPGR